MSTSGYGEHDDEPLPALGYRTYEVYQRERVAESSNLLAPRELIGDEMLTAPHRLLTILREHHPCYRDWVGNRFWITRYDDVTSVFTDDANYETRSKRWFAGQPGFGRDLRAEIPVLWAQANRIDGHVERIVDRMLGDLDRERGRVPDLATSFAARLPLELWGAVLRICRNSPLGTGGCSAQPAGNRAVGETGTQRRSNWSTTSSRCSPSGARRRVTTSSAPRPRSSSTGARSTRPTSSRRSGKPTTKPYTAGSPTCGSSC
jgi:hypothetical protein